MRYQAIVDVDGSRIYFLISLDVESCGNGVDVFISLMNFAMHESCNWSN